MRFNVINAINGEEVVLDSWYSTRIDDNLTLEWLLPIVAEKLEWPVSHTLLLIDDEGTGERITVGYIHRIRDRTCTRLIDFCSRDTECKNVFVMKLPPPDNFGPGSCICDFGGCCCECMVPGPYICMSCGNNGCCRCGDCGHKCCEERRAGTQCQGTIRTCAMIGCRPSWA